jgi:guanylate kinase
MLSKLLRPVTISSGYAINVVRIAPRNLVRKLSMAPTAEAAEELRPIVFSGPSGTGKSTLIKQLFSLHPNLFGFSVSHTTRKPRPGEEDGVHYHFTSLETFEKMVAEDAFEEHAKFGGNHYGSSRQAVKDVAEGKGKSIDGTTAEGKRICIFDIEMEGVKQLKKSRLNPRICFIQPPSIEVLEQRLRGRGDTSEDSIQKRLAQAKNEIEYCRSEGKNDKVIVNDDLETTFKELNEWVMKDISSSA